MKMSFTIGGHQLQKHCYGSLAYVFLKISQFSMYASHIIQRGLHIGIIIIK